MGNEKARFIYHIFCYKNKKKHEENAEFGNNTTSSACSAPLRENLLARLTLELFYAILVNWNNRMQTKILPQTSKFGKIVLLMLFCSIYAPAFGQDQTDETKSGIVPLTMLFNNIGWNVLHSFTYNYGLNFIGAGLGSWAVIGSGLDWKWNRLAYNNDWMPMIGGNANYVGYVVPALTPLTLYFTGLFKKDEKLQITGMALTQSLMLTMLIQTPFKIATGRTWPGIVDGWDSPYSKRSDRTDDYSGEFNWFDLDAVGGWPSGHTANAFSAAATIAQIYHDNTLLKAAVYTYASLIGLGMSVYDHWASDVMAGALIGFAIGTTVGKSYRNFTDEKENALTFYATPNSLGVIIRK
jgi:membrane-associated phospholipid phosphatase